MGIPPGDGEPGESSVSIPRHTRLGVLRQDRFAELEEVFERRDGYAAESRAAAIP